MFKKLLIVVALVAVGVASYGIVRAYFSKEVAATPATFTAGTINIDIAKNDANSSASVGLNNWMPGDTSWVAYDVKNNSTVPVTLSGHVDGAWDFWAYGTNDRLVTVTGAQYWDGSNWQELNANPHGSFTYADARWPGTLIQLPVNGTVTMRMQAAFNVNAENDYQGHVYTANVFVTAHQVGETVTLP